MAQAKVVEREVQVTETQTKVELELTFEEARYVASLLAGTYGVLGFNVYTALYDLLAQGEDGFEADEIGHSGSFLILS